MRSSGLFFAGLRKALRFHKHLANNTVSRNCLLKRPRINDRPFFVRLTLSTSTDVDANHAAPRDHGGAANFSDDGTRAPLFSAAGN